MKRAVWRGRFTVISREPVIVMDGAHNPAAAEELRKSLELYFPDKKLFYIFGMFQDKDYEKVTEITAPFADDATFLIYLESQPLVTFGGGAT